MRNGRSVKNCSTTEATSPNTADDLPEIRNWQWGGAAGSETANADTAADNI
jgi:hypothetical protein